MVLPDRRRRLAVAGGVAIVSLITYLVTAGDGPFWQDSGLFLAGVKAGGGLAPPGFPLYLVLVRPLVGLLTAVGLPFTWSVHAFSAVWGAVTAGLATLTVLWLATPGYRWFARGDTDTPAPALEPAALALGAAAGLAAGWSYSLWFQSVTAEVYSTLAAVAMFLLYGVVRLAAEGPITESPSRRQRGWLFALFAAYGGSYGVHPALAPMLAPALVALVVANWRLLASPGLVTALLGTAIGAALIPFLYLPWAAHAYPTAQFGDVTSLGTLTGHILGARFTAPGQSYGFNLERLWALPGQVWDELFVLGLAAAGFGVWRWSKLRPAAAWFAGLWLAGCLALPFIYVQGTEYDFWWMPLWGLLQVAAGLGLIAAWRQASPRVPAAARWPAVGALALATLLPHLLVNARYCNRRGYHVPEDFATDLLRHCEPGALYFAWSDQECSLTRYVHEVRGLRPDLIVLQGPVLPDPWYADWIRARYPALTVPDGPRPNPGEPLDQFYARGPDRMWAMQLAWANRPRPVYGSAKLPMKLPEGAAWVPVGGLWKLDWDAGEAPVIDPAHWQISFRNPGALDLPLRRHHAIKPHPGAPPRLAVRVSHAEEIRRFQQQAWLNRARWHLDHQEQAAAVESFVQLDLLAADVANAELWFEAGQTAYLAGRLDLCAQWFARVPDASPLAANRSLYLGQMAAAQGAHALAHQHYGFVRARAPKLWAEAEPKLRTAGLLPP